MPDTAEHDRWSRIYWDAFPHVYRALAAALPDPDAALDALHDTFEEGLRRPPPHVAKQVTGQTHPAGTAS